MSDPSSTSGDSSQRIRTPSQWHSALVRRRMAATKATVIGLFIGCAFGAVMGITIVLHFGGGSLREGLPNAVGYLIFYGFGLLVIMAAVGAFATILFIFLDWRIVIVLATTGLLSILISGVITSQPSVQLERVAEAKNLPEVDFEAFQRYPSFSDGTTYTWVARCSTTRALDLINALEMTEIPKMIPISPESKIMWPNERLADYRDYFETGDEEMIYYANDKGLLGTYSLRESLVRLVFLPSKGPNLN